MDHSARITLMGDGLELGVTLGPDLAQQALAHGGIAPEQVRELLASHGPSGHGTVSSEAFATLAGLSSPDGDLVPTRTIVMTDGLEYLFVANFTRPSGGSLTFHARYLEVVEGALPGSIVVVDDASRRQLALEPLNSSQKSVALALPSLASEAVTNASLAVSNDQAPPAPVAEGNILPAETEAPSGGNSMWVWCAGGLVVVAAVVLIWRLRVKRAG